MIKSSQHNFFFSGDTGYCEVFEQIGRVHGPFDLSAIAIGKCVKRDIYICDGIKLCHVHFYTFI